MDHIVQGKGGDEAKDKNKRRGRRLQSD